MTEQQIVLVKKSWKTFKAINPVIVGDAFYGQLFMSLPNFRSMLKITKEKQAEKLVEILNVIIGRLDKIEEITAELHHLALTHIGYGLKPEHYQTIGNALIWALEDGLGKYWDKNIEEAWTDCYAFLLQKMIELPMYAPAIND